MAEKLDWFPIDSRIFPINLSFPTPNSPWVRIALFLEILLAFVSVVGALILVVLPPPKIPPSPTTLPGYR